MYSKKMQYVIKSVPTDDKQALEDLLNEMSIEGWDLYTMHEVETEKSYDFNCIFMRERQESPKTELDDIVNVSSFKYRMEKMLSTPSSPYESCKELQLKISNQKDRIKKIKSRLDSENLSVEDKNKLNTQMSDELKQLDLLKQSLINEISPATMYAAIKEEKFTVCLSEEILELIDMESPDNLLAQTVKIRQKLKEELGYVIPLIQFNNSDDLMQNEFAIKLHGVEILRDVVFPNYVAYFKDELKGYIPTKDDYITEDIVTEKKLIWIQQDKVKDFWQQGFSAVEYIGRVIEYISIKEVSDIMDYNDVNSYIEIVLEHNSFLVDNIIPDFITAADLKYLLTCLVRERVSIKNIIYLFEKINDYANEPTKEDLLDKVRLAFSKQIMKDLSKEGEVKLIELEEDTVEAFAAFVENEDEDSVVRINADDVILIADKIKKLAKSKKASHIILIAPMSLRHMIYVILSEFIPSITVLAAEEVMAITDIKIIGKV